MKRKYLIIVLIIFIFYIAACNKSSSNIKHYLASGTTIDTNAKDVMPGLDELPEYKKIAYKYTHKSMILFESDSVALIVSYDDKTYESEKNKLKEKYVFLDNKINLSICQYIIPEYEFAINSYTFKVVAPAGKDNTEYPKSFGMIGTSDEKKSIAYLYFHDYDLDYIGKENDKTPMASFVKKYFKYNF